MRIRIAAAIALLAAPVVSAIPAMAQKQGGTLRIYHRDNPPSASIHEEATISTVMPFMGAFNNLVLFDQSKPRDTLDSIVPDLAESWAWSDDKTKVTFRLRQGVKWHDGKPFTAKDVECTFNMLTGKSGGEDVRKNPRQVWYWNVKEVKVNGDYEIALQLGEPQPSFMSLLATGYTPIYPCHVSARDMRSRPIGTGPFKVVEFKRNESIKLVRNPDYWKKGRPYLDAIDWRIIPNRSTRILAFIAGEFDLTWDADVTFPLLKDVKSQAPKAVCEARPTGVSTNLIVNSEAPPFNDPKIRRAMALAIDRKAFSDILGEGKLGIAGAMPGPDGEWALPPEMLAKLPGYGPDHEKEVAEARQIMESLGYGPSKPLKIKVSTRDTAIYRDPAVILIDQLKKIYIDGELEIVDGTIWHAKISRKDYTVGANLTGIGVDDPDVNFFENYTCKSERNVTGYCNPEVEKLIYAQSRETDLAKRKALVWEVQRKLIDDVARPIIYFENAATCWQPQVKGIVLHANTLYNGWRLEDVWLDK